MSAAVISGFALPAEAFVEPGDAILVKSSRPKTCAVCLREVTGSIVLPEDSAVCEPCVTVALRHMIVDAEAVRGGGSGAFRPSAGQKANISRNRVAPGSDTPEKDSNGRSPLCTPAPHTRLSEAEDAETGRTPSRTGLEPVSPSSSGDQGVNVPQGAAPGARGKAAPSGGAR